MMGIRSGSFTKTKRSWLSVVLVLAVVLASLALVTATAQAGSFDDTPPKAVLMKGATVVQTGRTGSSCWTSYDEGSGNWVGQCVDKIYTFPHAGDVLRAGTKIHIRLNKPQQPERFVITAYEGFYREQMGPIGEGRRLATNLRRVERDGKMVGW